MTARLPAAQRREQLTEVALSVFGELGYHAAAMNDIAAAAGVTKPVLYQHFDSKRTLFLELLSEVGGRLRDRITEAMGAPETPRAQVHGGFTAYFSFFAEEPAAFRVLFGDSARHDTQFAEEVSSIEDMVATSIASMIRPDELDLDHRMVLAHGIVGMAEGTSRYWASRGLDIDPGLLADTVADLAWAGLRGSAV